MTNQLMKIAAIKCSNLEASQVLTKELIQKMLQNPL